jgi:hypothetical protein
MLDRCSLDGAGGRIVVRDVVLERCTLRGLDARNVVFEDCVISHPKTTGRQSLIGCAFKHVVLRGPTAWIHIEPWREDTYFDVKKYLVAQVAEANAAYYRGVDWALDVREAVPDTLRIRGVPLELVRRDPARQLLVRREQAMHPVWQSEEPTETLWPEEVSSMAERDEPGLFLMAPPESSKHREKYEKAANALRRARVLDEKAGVVT